MSITIQAARTRDMMRRCVVPVIIFLLMFVGTYVRMWGLGIWQMSHDDAFLQTLATIPAPVPPFDYTVNSRIWLQSAYMPRNHWYDLITITPLSGHPALFYILMHAMMSWTTNPLTLKLLGYLPGIATIPVAYLLGKYTSGRLSGLIAAVLLTFSDVHIVFSQENRSYALFLLLLSLMVLSILRYDTTRKTIWLSGYFIFAALALFTNFGAVIMISCIGFAGIVRKCRFHQWRITALLQDRRFLAWCTLHALLAAFYLWQSYHMNTTLDTLRGTTKIDWMLLPTSFHVLAIVIVMLQVPAQLFFSDITLCNMLTTFMFGFGLWALYRDRRYEWLVIAVAAYVVTGVLVFLEMHPHYAARHFVHLFPIFLIVCSYPFTQSLRIDGVKITSLFIGIFLVFVTINLFGPGSNGLDAERYRMYINGKADRNYTAKQEDWNNLQKALDKATRPGDLLVTDQSNWLLYTLQEKLGYPVNKLFREQHFYACANLLRVFHFDKLFNACLHEAAAAHPEAQRIWYIFENRRAHQESYEGPCLVDYPQTTDLYKALLQKIEFPTIGAYALSPKNALAPGGIIKLRDTDESALLQPRKECR